VGGSTRTRVWLWPNLLSLDAPLVALVWQVLFVRCLHGTAGVTEGVMLGLAVWLIYAADRMLDAWRGAGTALRHGFYGKYWRTLSAVWVAALVSGLWFAWERLPDEVWLRGVIVAAGVTAYLTVLHGLPRRWHAKVKEAAVGVVFALGVSLVAWPVVETWAEVLAIALFAVLCWMNCVAIEDWERGRSARDGVWIAASVVALASVLLLPERRPVLAGAETASALGLILLDRFGRELSREALRVLADVVLLSPLLFLGVAGRVV
jgi:hypothetical protein